MRRSCLFAWALVTLTKVAQAAPSSDADRKFEEGRTAATSGEYGRACALFRESYEIDPATGTLMNIADCEEHLGNTAEALEIFERALAQLPVSDDRISPVRQRIAELEKRVGRLVVALGRGAPSDARYIIDGRPVDPDKMTHPIRVTPGTHVLSVTAIGYRGSRHRITLAAGQSTSMEVWPGPPLDDDTPRFSEDEERARQKRRAARVWRAAGFGALGLGAASLWVGSVTGVLAIDRESTRSDHCDAYNRCDAVGYDAAQSGKTLATWSTITMVGGAALAGAGLYLVLSHASSEPVTLSPSLSSSGAGAAFTGAF